ncbi:DUF445 domain-containing protein [Microbacterium pseudoresistens]|uniref:Uncharacterized membrane-anchored protein YjiN (DUF445 family) n=1 Tax=Microbacterium pseudoresistens TaxID=640634 RepID=A0A7Y9ET23_9MICO|nr:DUF445 domain-containing protein [Microbacterium pseudoresistens]NYD53321.1 uncharacterized membrane-anchored protein YjiN (DUF445 family) [Microbacterium pseudoresistens]
MPRTPMALLSPADQERLRALRLMKGVALGALVFMAIVFVIAFWLQGQYPWLGYVRAAAEGGMVGALADWFAVTALFRHPLGLPIPHTAIIPTRKDEIGSSLGEFVETNFLSGDVVRTKLSETAISRRLGEWLRDSPEHGVKNAERITAEAATMASAVLRALDDDDVRDLISDLAREHLIEPEWGSPAGAWLERIVDAGAHHGAVDLAADSIGAWLDSNAQAFAGLVSRRLPGWVPKLAHRFVDETVYNEAVKFVRAVQADPNHPARHALDGYLARLADNLQHDPETRTRLENAKAAVFDSPRVGALAAEAWNTAKAGLLRALADPQSGLRIRARDAVAEVGSRLATEQSLQHRVDGWVTDAAVFLVDRYRHDIASVITDTVERWDPAETTEKIELMVGRDLQYIRLNGTIVGAIAGVAIFTVAHALIPGV